MVRIKTTTSNGKEFFSQFIYTEGTGVFTIEKLKKWHKKPSYELVCIDFKDCQEDCFYNQHWGISDILRRIGEK